MMAFSRNRIAKKIVQRLRFRSTIEPPPSGPVPLPTTKAPDIPESLPECISTRKTKTTDITTCRTDRIASTPQAYRAQADLDPITRSRPGAAAGALGRWTLGRASDYERFSHACLAADSNGVREARV